jgi:Uma2 family endonuclease
VLVVSITPAVSIDAFEELDNALPEGFTAELINRRIVVSPAPDGDHDEDVIYVADQIHTRLPEAQLYQDRGLAVGTFRDGRARADGVVAPRRYFRGQPSWADASGVLLVVEVTSGAEVDAEVDRVEKRDAYAASSIPVYLLVDRHRGEAVVH